MFKNKPSEFQFKTVPYAHQLKVFEQSRDHVTFALLMEQRTGKTKVVLDTAAWLCLNDRIDCLIVISLNGVHRNWVTDEVPAHLPDWTDPKCLIWSSDKSGKTWEAEKKAILGHQGLAVVAVNVQATLTDRCEAYLRALLKQRRVMMVIDESTIIKTPGAARTKRIWALGKLAKYRRILTGTPVPEGPLDAYAQFKFLHPDILGFNTFTGFKYHFAEFKRITLLSGHAFDELVAYKNMDEFQKRIATRSFRVERKDCFDMPPKVFSPPRYFELSPEQKKLYVQLREEFVAEYRGHKLTAALAIVRLTRLQQVACGFWPTPNGTDEPVSAIGGKLPRIEALLELLEEECWPKTIIWCRFRADVQMVQSALKKAGRKCVTYDGSTNEEDRALAKARFQSEPGVDFIGNPAVGGYGLDLSQGDLAVYYSNVFSLEQRLQSEDRPQHPMRKKSVGYYDIVGVGTVDETVVKALREKRSLSDLLTSGLTNPEVFRV